MHEFTGTFQGQAALFRVTAVTGHVYSYVPFSSCRSSFFSLPPLPPLSPPSLSVLSVLSLRLIRSTDFTSSFQNWNTTDPSSLFDAPVVKSPEGKGGMCKHLQREAKGVDVLV